MGDDMMTIRQLAMAIVLAAGVAVETLAEDPPYTSGQIDLVPIQQLGTLSTRLLDTLGNTALVETAPARAPVDTSRSCQSLSLEVEGLLALKNKAAAGFWSDEKNQMASAAGAVFKPAWFYLGYAAIRHFQGKQGSSDATQRIAALRNAMADKLCFVQ